MMPRLSTALLASFLTIVVLCRMEAQESYTSSIISPSPFMGNNDEIFKLADGSIWQVKYEYEYLYAYYPEVVICPSLGKLIIGTKSLNVQLIAGTPGNPRATKNDAAKTNQWELIENTNLEGSISGTVSQGRIFKTISGGLYEVSGLTLQLVLELQPDVIILRNGNTYKLIVDGFDEPLICRKLN